MKKLLLLLMLSGAVVAGYVLVHQHYFAAGANLPPREAFHCQGIKFGRVVESINTTGILQPREMALVTCAQAGQVAEIWPQADFNRKVNKDDPLLRLDDRLAREKLEQAKAVVALANAEIRRVEAVVAAARSAYERHQELFAQGFGQQKDVTKARLDFQTAEAALQMAQARLHEANVARNLAQLQLDMTVIRSPITGVILDKKVLVGQTLSPLSATPLFTIAGDLGRMRLVAQVAEGDIDQIRPGLRAVFTVNDRRFEGQVTQIRSVPNHVQSAVYFPVVIDVENHYDSVHDQWWLRPGMSVSVDILTRQREDSWLVPTEALDFLLDDQYMTAAARHKLEAWRGKPNWRPVWMLRHDNEPWPIFIRLSGPGEEALRGSEGLTEAGLWGAEYQQVLEWDPDPLIQDRLRHDQPEQLPELITSIHQVKQRSLFVPPKFPKLF
ncbi:MAG: efflux RND transporter periplasmic adaptor subunit [Gemmataceae bacterium]